MRTRPMTAAWRRRAALAGALFVASGFMASGVLLPWAAQASAASPSPSPTASTSSPSTSPTALPSASPSASPSTPAQPGPAKPPAAPRGGIVVEGPRLWDPAGKRLFASHSYVTVSQAKHLTNQVVEVRWQGFTPSSDALYSPDSTDYPVMVAECQGTHPTKWSQCFGADNGGVAGTFSAYGPMNTAYATTSRNGTGQAPIQLLTAEEDQQLGCKDSKACSLVIVPAQGGNIFDTPVRCGDHSQDTDQTDVGSVAFSSQYGQCSWRDRIIVPLHFSPTPADCPVRSPDFSVIGSPMAERAMVQWQSALCASSNPLNIQYDSAQSEPLAREDFLSGLDDVALTTLPATGSGKHPYTYAPIAISSVAITYWVDNPRTGQPRGRLRLDPSLVLKMLTQSYDFDKEGCGNGKPPKSIGCDNAVDADPISLFADPEFKKLNPHVASVGDGYQIPTVLGGESDMTYELTRWLAANSAAKSFADGTFDPWGEHVNTSYLKMQLPTNTLNSMDAYLPVAHRYSPQFPLSAVAAYQVDNWYPATNWVKDAQGNYDKLSPETPGDRALFAILDEADAAAFQLPVAAIENPAGQYVEPTNATMAAALGEMQTGGNHITQQQNDHGKVKNAYPLTMVIYALVPTGGISKTKAARIAQFLDFVAGSGQRPGQLPGQLAPGYLPLTSSMRTQTLKAAQEVLDQTGGSKHHGTAGSVSASASATASATAPPRPAGQAHHRIGLGLVSNPATAGLARYALPVLLIGGCLLVAAGSAALVAGRGSAAVLTRLRGARLARWLPALGRKKP
ncbi:MAG TPA: hypothetical protein VNW50_05535 [Streptosporangiaceae bacterium]|nr:hypothetical protein [Streptosporangiaceae bacterium]